MRPYTVWLRRGTGALLGPALVLLFGVTLWRDHPWIVDAAWGARYVGVLTKMAAPVVAAAVAYDHACRFRPTLSELAAGGQRRVLASLLPVASVFSVALTVVATAVTGVCVAVTRHGGLMGIDPWFVPEAVLALVAVVLIGAAVGCVVDGLVAPVVAALVVLLLPVLLAAVSTDLANSVLTVAYTDGTQLGLEREPGAAVAALCTHLAIGVYCALIALGTPGPRPRWAMRAMAAVVVAAISVQALTFPPGGTFRPSSEDQDCVGTRVTVCGPARAREIFDQAQRDLSASIEHLSGSGLSLPHAFVYARTGTNGWSATTTKLVFDLETMDDGHLPRSAIVQTLSAPRACVGFFGEEDFDETARRTTLVSAWLNHALAQRSAGEAPANVRLAYRQLLSCRTADDS